MKKYLLLSLITFIIGFTSCKSSKVITKSVFDISEIKIDVETLSADEMEGRETGTRGEQLAAQYISKRMKTIGLNPKGDNDGYIQIFTKRIKSNPHSNEPSADDKVVLGKNIIGYIDNGVKNTVVIGAHYDHLGYGAEGSLYVGEPAIHNGADDNASGVAGLLRIATKITNIDSKKFNYLFIAFSGEEKGLWGSNYFTKHPTIEKEAINYMINMDMIGRLNAEKQLAIYGTGTTPTWNEALKTKSTNHFKIKEEKSGMGPTDHTSFYLEDIPVLQFFTGQHEDYHKPSDDAHLINYNGIVQITDYILEIINNTVGKGKLRFTKTEDAKKGKRDFKVTLGVMPDYLFDGLGMKIDGVKDNRPADLANLKKGDVVIKMGHVEIFDMMSYMHALGVFEKGQTIDITIIRDGKENIRKLTF
ncbi:MAG: M20/M25/M40 family metallo-hydrolase [Saprospiraceae bacterium]